MTLGIIIGAGVMLAAIAVAMFTVLYLRTPNSSWPQALIERRDELRFRLAGVVERAPDKPNLLSNSFPSHKDAARVEAKILARDPRGALRAAEELLPANPTDPDVHVLLSRALVHCDELEAAADEIARARAYGATGPMSDYLEGRVGYALIVRQTNKDNAEVMQSPVPSMITPFEMFVLQLERQRRSSDKAASVWLAGMGNETMDHDDILSLVTEHFGSYYDSLEKLLSATEAEPGFAEALYHVARLSLKVGFLSEGRALFDAIEPLMVDSTEREFYRRDIATLRDEAVSSQVASLPTIAEGAKRSTKLRVLN